MKKLLLLSVIALTIMACPSDDDSPQPVETSIIGTWKFLESFENGVQDPIESCDTDETLVFSENGDYSGDYYDDFNQSGTCELVGTINGTWSNTGSLYSLTYEGETETVEVTFEGDTFYIEDTYVEDGETFTDKIVYIKQ